MPKSKVFKGTVVTKGNLHYTSNGEHGGASMAATHLAVKGHRVGYLAELFEFRGRTRTREIPTKPFPRWILSSALKGPPNYQELAET